MALIDKCNDVFNKSFVIFMRGLGWVLGIGLYVLLGVHLYAYFKIICVLLHKRLGTKFGLVWISIGLSLVYNICFNHFLAMTIKPGNPKDLARIEKLKQKSDIKTEDDRFEGLQVDVKRLMKYRTKTISELQGIWHRDCPKCNFIKPARTHHCSICNTCVLHMDHHCPWINNCVGHENYRFFLLFLIYLLIGAVYFIVSCAAVWQHFLYQEHHHLMGFLMILDVALVVIMGCFNIWNWFLACTGLSTLEFIGQMSKNKEVAYDYSFSRVRDNLFKVFGTKSYWQILSPSLRNNKFTGIEWSFQMKDLGFDEYGIIPEDNEIQLKDFTSENTEIDAI